MQTKRRLIQILLMVFVTGIIAGCALVEINDTDIAVHTETPSPTATPSPTNTRPPQSTASPTPTFKPTPTVPLLAETDMRLLSGLLYGIDDTIWTIDDEGNSQQLYDCFASRNVSSDLRYALFVEEWNLWLMDHQSCTSRNLTNTSGDEEEFEGGAMWWPGRTDTVLMGVYGAPYSFGSPSTLNIRSGEISVLSEEISSGPSFSPNGRKFAFSGFPDKPLVYDMNSGVNQLEIPRGQLPGEIERIASPAWSHDGTRIAWIAGIEGDDSLKGWNISLIIIELESTNASILHSYLPLGVDGWPLAAEWSPDDKWLALYALAENPKERGIWLIPADGGPGRKLPIVSSGLMFWSPNSDYLLINSLKREPDDEPGVFSEEVWFLRIDTWEIQRIDQLSGASIIDWR
ncbi:MAG: hypothetical protein D8M60_10300 [Chloroflexi bacterium]|nr:hypothetical protein [Chloroflexota bacterium]